MLFLVLLLAPLPAFLPQQCTCTQAPPFTTLVSSYPFGEQLSIDVTPTDALVFAAEGAVISILNPIYSPMQVIDQVPLPDCQPLALRYYKHPITGDSWLFIAGGTEGLWRVEICPNVMGPPPPMPLTKLGLLRPGKYVPVRSPA